MPADELYKEPCFFSPYGENLGLDNYLRLFRFASPVQHVIGEASTVYLTDPVSAKRIFEFNPDAKIIIVLRNPIERAYSLYNWMVQDGYEYAPSFKDALSLEVCRLTARIPNWFEPQYYWNYLYIRSGLYYEQVKRYVDYFKERVLVLRFEEMKADPQGIFDTVCTFLGIQRITKKFRKHNVSKSVRSPKIQFILRHLNTYIGSMLATDRGICQIREEDIRQYYRVSLRQLSSVTRITLRDRLIGTIFLRNICTLLKKGALQSHQTLISKKQRDLILQLGLVDKKPAPLAADLKTRLSRCYAVDVEKLSKLSGLDFSEWLHDG